MLGFDQFRIKTDGAEIFGRKGGSGPPLLLLHGHPQTHFAWHKVAPALAERFTVVMPDLRGYGDSSKPDGGERHRNYSFRSMANDQIAVMSHFGFAKFLVAGHDRGARVAHRLCLDHPESVEKVAMLDIAPTLTMYRETNKEFATRYVWWFFQIQPAPTPEHMIGLDPEFYLRHHLEVQCKTPGAIGEEALKEYLRCYCRADTIHAACEDYRASADIDLEMDAADEEAGRRIAAPALVLWGALGTVGLLYDVLDVWRSKCERVSGRALDCGHLLPEEAPDHVIAEFIEFFS
jgi:haloacetate dehalogenase